MITNVEMIGDKYVRITDEDRQGFTAQMILDREDLTKIILAMYPTTYVKHPYVGVVVAGHMHDLQEHQEG